MCWPLFKPQISGEPTCPGLLIVKESVVQAPIAALSVKEGLPAVPKTGLANVCVVKSYLQCELLKKIDSRVFSQDRSFFVYPSTFFDISPYC